ncbi:MAG: tetratricopeptide repeat protein, partial [Ignavibacteria bacterium]|nr:tetratricopeptide repeat protein [Ignavibacteria bacterium]
NASDLDKEQFSHHFPDGVDERVIVDKIITLSERLLLKEKYFDLLIELAKIMIKIGNQAFAQEILSDLKNLIGTNGIYRLHNGEANLLISKIYWSQAQWDDCDFYLNEAYSSFKSISYFEGYAKCENMLGTLYGEKGDFQKALNHFESALTYLKESDDLSTQAMILTNLGIIYTIYGDFEKAIWNYKDSIEKFKKLNDNNRIARVYHNIGMLYTRMGEYYLALEQFNISITLSIENNYLSNSAVSYIGKAFIYTKLKNLQLADAFTDKAMEIACKINDTLSIADIYRIKGIIQSNLNNFELSEEFFENSIRLNDDFESNYNKAESSKELGNLLNKEDRKDEAEVHLKSAEQIFKDLKKE